jgi:hypothetical protein
VATRRLQRHPTSRGLGRCGADHTLAAQRTATPAKLPRIEHPADAVLRKVSTVGDVRWRCAKIAAGHGLVGEYVRIEEAGDLVNLWYGPHRIRQIPVDRLRQGGLL